MKNVLTPLAKIVLVPLQLTSADLPTDAVIQRKKKKEKNYGLGARTSVFSNEDLNDVMKTVKTFEESRFLIKCVSKTVKNGIEEQKGGFLSILAASLGASLLGSMLSGKGVITARSGTIRIGEGHNF